MEVAEVHKKYPEVASYNELQSLQVTQPWELNNTALKRIRDQNENPRGHVKIAQSDLTRLDPRYVGVIDEVVGTECTWRSDPDCDDDARQPWSWRQFLAGLPDCA